MLYVALIILNHFIRKGIKPMKLKLLGLICETQIQKVKCIRIFKSNNPAKNGGLSTKQIAVGKIFQSLIWGFIPVIFCFIALTSAFAQEGAQIEIFSPQEIIKDARQVSVRFSDQMVSFGDPRGIADPFEIVCPEKGSGRWADGRNWIFDFDRNLQAGVSCEFRLKDEVKTLSGKDIVGRKLFSFNTGGPSVRSGTIPYEGSNIEEEQIFILVLDCEPDLDSVRQHVFFSVDGIENNIGIKIIEGKVRQDILKSQGRYASWVKEKQEGSIVLIQSRQRFPAKTNISLIWGKDVKAKSGVKNEQDQIMHFAVREPFSVEFNCLRENAAAGCIPFAEMSLYFSAPISKTQAAKIVLKRADGTIFKPHLESANEDLSGFFAFRHIGVKGECRVTLDFAQCGTADYRQRQAD